MLTTMSWPLNQLHLYIFTLTLTSLDFGLPSFWFGKFWAGPQCLELSPIFHIVSEFVFSKSGLESKLMDMSNLMVVMGQRKLLIQLACV
jgi:hypothetical protein